MSRRDENRSLFVTPAQTHGGYADSVSLGDGLKAKVFRGGAWLGSGSLAEQTARFGRNMILARLLAPEAFGTMAIALSVGSIIHSVTDIGVKEAIIQNPRGGEDHYASAAWWLAIGRALSLYAIVFLLAGGISSFYGNRELAPLLRVLALGVIFDGALSSKAYVAVKEMRFGKWAGINHGGGICGVIITVVLSVFIRDTWALVLGNLVESASRCVLSYVLCPYLPSLSWDREAIKDLLRFSKGIFGLAFLNLIFVRTDIFVLAKLYSAFDVGLYAMAINLVQTPAGFVMNLLGQTLLPTFSSVQEQDTRIHRILLKVTTLLLILGMPVIVFVFFCGRSVLSIVYGHIYARAAGPLIVASCVALVNLLNGQITTIFYAKGVPQLHRRCVMIMAIAMIALIYPFVRLFGVVGAQLACLVSIVLGWLFQVLRIRQYASVHVRQYGKVFGWSLLISCCVAAVCFGALTSGKLARPVPIIMLGITGCVVSYLLGWGIVLRGKSSAV